MNSYDPASRPAVSSVAALVMTTITVAVMVVLPAKLDSARVDARALAAARPANAPVPEAVAGRLRVDVVADRDALSAPVQARLTAPKRKAQGPGRVSARSAAAPERVGYRGPAADPAPCAI
ncbi:MAG: hypothetical protein ACREYD_06935 [Casimicrobiaceae bacterium]